MIIIAIFFFIHQKVEKMMEKKLVWEDYYGRRERKETNTSLVELCMNFHHYYIKNWWGDGLCALKFHCKKSFTSCKWKSVHQINKHCCMIASHHLVLFTFKYHFNYSGDQGNPIQTISLETVEKYRKRLENHQNNFKQCLEGGMAL